MDEMNAAFEKASRIAEEALTHLQKIRTEEDTKIKIITRILTECLGWTFPDIAAESAHENGFSDYLISNDGKGSLLVEAKRIGALEIATAEKAKVRHLKIAGPALAKVMPGIDQAASYSMPNGLPVSVLTDGLAWIVFKTFVPGENFKSKEAIVFPGIEAVLKDFPIFFELLSKVSFGKKLYNRVFDQVHQPRLAVSRTLLAALPPLLSGLIFWTMCKALILLCSERFATFWTRKEINAMRHHNTVLHQLLKQIPWTEFDRLVDEHKADKHVRTLSTKSQLIAMVFAQISGAASLREIEGGLKSHATCLYHLGAGIAKRSTLADANRQRSAEVFCALFAVLLKQVNRGLRRKLADATYLIDSTSLHLTRHAESWARYSTNVCSAKAHVIYDPNADRPVYFSISAGNVNDITAAQQMPIQPGATYVFDLGYYDFRWWAKLDEACCRIVTRLKKNTPLKVIEELAPPEDSLVLSDRIGFLPERQSYTRKNPMQNAVREVRVKTDTGKVLRILTNDLDATAQEIADLYKSRWLIELFFRWIKQNLKIRHLLGTTENAVRIQIAASMIAFLLLRLAQSFQAAIASPLAFARLVRSNIMHRRRIDRLLEHEPLDPPNQHQMILQWT